MNYILRASYLILLPDIFVGGLIISELEVIYHTRKTVFDHNSKSREES